MSQGSAENMAMALKMNATQAPPTPWVENQCIGIQKPPHTAPHKATAAAGSRWDAERVSVVAITPYGGNPDFAQCTPAHGCRYLLDRIRKPA